MPLVLHQAKVWIKEVSCILPWISNASMQLLKQLKDLIIIALILLSCKSFLNLMCCFPLISKTVWLFHKSSLIYKFLCKCSVCYIGHTTQRLDIQMNQHILSNIHTNTSNYTAALKNQNSSSAIAYHLLDDPGCAATYKPTMFTILEKSIKLQLSILEALLIMKHKPELCIQKQFYTPLLFNNPIGPHEENITHTNSSGFW